VKKSVSQLNPELRSALNEADRISAKAVLSKTDEIRLNVLLAKIKTLRELAPASQNGYSKETRQWLRDFVGAREVKEIRGTDMLAGTQSITYAEGSQGGFFIPAEFEQDVIHGMAQIDPFLNEDVVTLSTSTDLMLRPKNFPAFDLSSFAATRVGEGNQENPETVPALSNKVLNGYTYKAALDATFELEDDAADTLTSELRKAFSVGLARGIGIDLTLGTGSNQPQGVLTGAANSGVTCGAHGSLLLDDFTEIYFSVDRAYRTSPKCAWAMDDATYQLCRQATDNSGRPLLRLEDDCETILGKPVRISPSMPSGSSAKIIVFGDLSHFVVRCSGMRMVRSIQGSGYVDKGKALYACYMRADAAVLDATGGAKPPIVYATSHS
jgi:HK97 family phage major capsid protein